MARFRLFAPAITLLALLFVPTLGRSQVDAGTPARTEAELRTLYTGAWNLSVSHTSGQTTIDRGIERCVTEMNYFVQSIARTQLHDQTPVNDRIDIAFPSGQIQIGFDGAFTPNISKKDHFFLG